MNADELKRLRDYASHYQGSDVSLLVELIDEQAKQLIAANHRYADLQQVCDDQAKQITTLKAALVDSNVRSEYPRYDELPEEDWEEKRSCGKDDFHLLRYRGKRRCEIQ